MLRNPPAVRGPVRFVLVILTVADVNGDAGAHAGRKFGKVGPLRVKLVLILLATSQPRVAINVAVAFPPAPTNIALTVPAAF